MVLAQTRILKTTIEHLKSAYNGKDIDWHDTSKIGILIENLTRLLIDFSLSTVDSNEESYEHSGSGEYDGDDDDDSGSGLGGKIFKHSSTLNKLLIILINNFADTRTTDLESETEPPIVSKVPTQTSNAETKEDHSKESHHPETVPPPTPDSASSLKHWREKRLLITYFLPIVMAWFGGSISAAVSDLL